MTPSDFVDLRSIDDERPRKFAKAINQPLRIFSAGQEWEVLSYYLDESGKGLCLDIEEKLEP